MGCVRYSVLRLLPVVSYNRTGFENVAGFVGGTLDVFEMARVCFRHCTININLTVRQSVVWRVIFVTYIRIRSELQYRSICHLGSAWQMLMLILGR